MKNQEALIELFENEAADDVVDAAFEDASAEDLLDFLTDLENFE